MSTKKPSEVVLEKFNMLAKHPRFQAALKEQQNKVMPPEVRDQLNKMLALSKEERIILVVDSLNQALYGIAGMVSPNPAVGEFMSHIGWAYDLELLEEKPALVVVASPEVKLS